MAIMLGGKKVAIYLGDKLVAGGGGDLTQNIQTAIDTPNPEDLARLMIAPEQIYTNPGLIKAIANSEASIDYLMQTPSKFFSVVKKYPEARAIYYSSPYLGKFTPGAQALYKGDLQLGYYGEMPASEFGTFTSGSQSGKALNPTTLAAEIGLSSGNVMNPGATWQKFAYKGDVWYISMLPIRYNLSWDSINNVKAVFGGATFQTTRGKFSVWLLTGGSQTDTIDSVPLTNDTMWDKLLRPLKAGGTWGTSYTDAQLGFANSGNGYDQWCQEAYGNYKTMRYGSGGAGSFAYFSSISTSNLGWRPALKFTL